MALDELSSSNSEGWLWIISHASIVSGPIIAWLYSILVWATYSFYKECSWSDSGKLTGMSLRFALVVGAVACSIGISASSESQQEEATQHPHVTSIVLLAILFWILSGYAMYMTRMQDVVGFITKPYFGSNHLQGQIVVITGANQGIGKETTIQLATMGAKRIYMLCRSKSRAEKARQELLNNNTDRISKDQLHILPIDLGSYASIRNAVEELQAHLESDENNNNNKISVLINNAGLMMGTQTTSQDGHDLMMQANHLGHFLLTRLLMDKKLLQDDARILNISSSTHELCPRIDFDDLFCTKGRRTYTLFGQYSMTKLANILFTKALVQKQQEQQEQQEQQNSSSNNKSTLFANYKCYAVHPGIVRTNVTSNMQWYFRVLNTAFAYIVASIQKVPSEGAYSQVYIASVPTSRLPPNGSYISNGQPYPSSRASQSMEDAKRLWQISEEYVGLAAETNNGSSNEKEQQEEKKE